MKERFSIHPIGMGSTSLLAMFVILSLIAFSVLSYSSAKNDEEMAERTAASISSYYAAQNQGEEILAKAISAYDRGDTGALSDLGVTAEASEGGVVFQWQVPFSQGKILVYDVTYAGDTSINRNTKVIME